MNIYFTRILKDCGLGIVMKMHIHFVERRCVYKFTQHLPLCVTGCLRTSLWRERTWPAPAPGLPSCACANRHEPRCSRDAASSRILSGSVGFRGRASPQLHGTTLFLNRIRLGRAVCCGVSPSMTAASRAVDPVSTAPRPLYWFYLAAPIN